MYFFETKEAAGALFKQRTPSKYYAITIPRSRSGRAYDAGGELSVRNSADLTMLETRAPRQFPADTAGRTMAELLEKLMGQLPETATNSNEEILLDTEVDGSRYLLVRMPKRNPQVQLSPREQEIVRMVAKGHPNKVIADVLNISSWTVCTHLRRIFAKLGVGSRAAMVAQLIELGVLTHEPCTPRVIR
jgi:DNA-binding CsgD family transcriptional regulator